MADDVILNAGSGGDTISADDIAGVKVQRVKIQYGVDGSATDVSDTSPLPIDDAGGSLTVDGTVTANLSATDNAVLDAIDSNTDYGAVVGGGVEASALRVTLASDSTGVLTVDGTVTANLSATDNAVLDSIDTAVNGTLTVDSHAVTNAGTFAVQVDGDALTALQTIDNSVFADNAAFTLGSSSVNMAGAIRDDSLSSLSAVEGDAVPLRVSSTGALHVTGGGGGTEYSEDAATPSTITGTATVMERDDALSTLTPIEGDWAAMRCDSQGALWVNAVNAGGTATVDSASGGTDEGAVMLAVRDDSLTTLTPADGDYTHLRVSSTGALHVTGGGGGTEYTEDVATPAAITGTATLMERDDALATLTPVEGDWASFRCSAEGALWVQDFNSDAILADTASMDTNLGTVAGAVSGTEMQVDVVASLPAGTNAIGKLAANSGVDIGDVDVTSISAGSNLIGDVGISGARTSGGTSLKRFLDLDETAEEVKSSAGQIYWIHAMNLTAAVLYLKIYSAPVASVTVGTTTPELTFPIATQGDTNGAGFVFTLPNGIDVGGTGITAAVTTGVADNDTTGPAANGCVVNIGYA